MWRFYRKSKKTEGQNDFKFRNGRVKFKFQISCGLFIVDFCCCWFFFLVLFNYSVKSVLVNFDWVDLISLFMRAHRTQCRCLKRFSLCIIAIGLLPILIVYFLVSDQLYYRIKRTDVSINFMHIKLALTTFVKFWFFSRRCKMFES